MLSPTSPAAPISPSQITIKSPSTFSMMYTPYAMGGMGGYNPMMGGMMMPGLSASGGPQGFGVEGEIRAFDPGQLKRGRNGHYGYLEGRGEWTSGNGTNNRTCRPSGGIPTCWRYTTGVGAFASGDVCPGPRCDRCGASTQSTDCLCPVRGGLCSDDVRICTAYVAGLGAEVRLGRPLESTSREV